MEQEALKKAIDASVETHGFSGVVSIRQDGAVLYQCTAGYADRSNRRPNTLRTRFGTGSGSEFFTALVIGMLIEVGKLSFSTRLEDVVSLGLSQYSDDITIRHLLTHTSGIPDCYDEDLVQDFDSFMLSIPGYGLRGPRDYLRVFPDGPMKLPPGERFCYSNSGYILLGIVIEAVTGRAYRAVVQKQWLEPIGMHRSGDSALDRLPEETAWGYAEEDDGWRTNIYNVPIIGSSDGGAFVTADDLAALWDAFWAHKILCKETVDVLTQPFVRAGKRRHYGHGIWIYDAAGRRRQEYI